MYIPQNMIHVSKCVAKLLKVKFHSVYCMLNDKFIGPCADTKCHRTLNLFTAVNVNKILTC